LSDVAARGLASLSECAIEQALAGEELLDSVCRKLGLEQLARVDESAIDARLATALPIHFTKRHVLLPLREVDGQVELLCADPLAMEALDDCRRLLAKPLRLVVSSRAEVERLINRVYDQASGSAKDVMETLDGMSLEGSLQDLPMEPTDLLDSADDAPIIRLVNTLLSEAVKKRASDIHIEPYERDLAVRFRVDGVLHNVIRPPRQIHSAISSRIKVMAALDIAEKRVPQDGRIKIRIGGREVDIRVSVLPTAYGERVVMRLLDRGAALLRLPQLGMVAEALEPLMKWIRLPHGMLLVTGPTGSGKTTTLYASLMELNSEDRNILTIEDPIEYELGGVGQIQVNAKTGLTFASGLRSILRQDPDIIMVGEIRDVDAARIAIQASLTGHLVLSTLHTNDAASACARLVDMGVEPFLLASALVGVGAQRLVRVLCTRCREPYRPPAVLRAELGLGKEGVLYRARGCEACLGTGYQGRNGIYEVLPVDEVVRQLIHDRGSTQSMREHMTKRGWQTIRQAGMQKAAAGITSVEEVVRVTQAEEI
jgi:general secretion pathway protein E